MNDLVFDIETQNTFNDVGGDINKLKISVVSIYTYSDKKFRSFSENELINMWPYFEKADKIIGYNSEHFDLPILNNYYLGDLAKIPHLDLLKVIKDSIGRRIKLDDVAQATLDIGKSADGLQAIKWWREGEIDKIKRYCEQDVLVTRDIYDFGRENNQLFYKNITGEVIPFAVEFNGNTNEQEVSNNINLSLGI